MQLKLEIYHPDDVAIVTACLTSLAATQMARRAAEAAQYGSALSPVGALSDPRPETQAQPEQARNTATKPEKPKKDSPKASDANTPPAAASSPTTAGDQPGAAATSTGKTSDDTAKPLDFKKDVGEPFLKLVEEKGRAEGRKVILHFMPDAGEGERLSAVLQPAQYAEAVKLINELRKG